MIVRTITKIKTITSHAGYARFLATLTSEDPIGTIPRKIHTPYAYGPTHIVWALGDKQVFTAEVRHKRYEVWEVTGELDPYVPGVS